MILRGLLFIHCIFNAVKDIIREHLEREDCSMPRKADARLEGRILEAAYRLWSRRGEHALTMRAVARASGTTTPTLYERFSNKEDLLSLLCRRVLDFFVAHPNDYRLITEDWAIAFARKEDMPSFEFLKRSLASQLGGKPDRHTPLALALVGLLHGTATLLHSASSHQKISRDFRGACVSACESLIQAASARAAHSKRTPQSR